MTQDLAGKVMLLTGATEGIGKAAALELARRGAALTLVGRNPEKSARVVAELKAQSGNANIALLLGDMSTLAGIRSVAQAFKATHDRLDVLINNAGAVFQKHQLTSDGFELTFALNHLGYFLLTRELYDLITGTPGARVVSTSSAAHRSGRMKLDSIARRPSGTAGFAAYGDSKLANILFTSELARRLAGTGATANCFHPGFVRTAFGQNNGGFLAGAITVAGSLFARTPEKGAETLVWLATSPEAAPFSGEYFQDKQVAKSTRLARDATLAKDLWKLSDELCG